jgi:hypothetical protein
MVGFNRKKLNYLQPKSVYECNLKKAWITVWEWEAKCWKCDGKPNVGNNVMGSDIWACVCTKVNETRREANLVLLTYYHEYRYEYLVVTCLLTTR